MAFNSTSKDTYWTLVLARKLTPPWSLVLCLLMSRPAGDSFLDQPVAQCQLNMTDFHVLCAGGSSEIWARHLNSSMASSTNSSTLTHTRSAVVCFVLGDGA